MWCSEKAASAKPQHAKSTARMSFLRIVLVFDTIKDKEGLIYRGGEF